MMREPGEPLVLQAGPLLPLDHWPQMPAAAQAFWMSSMNGAVDGFRELATRARGLCEDVACVLEGGYNVETLPDLVRATVEGMEQA